MTTTTTESTSTVLLREASAEDAPALRALSHAHFADLLPGLPAALITLQGQAQVEGYRASYPRLRELVVDAAGEVVGRMLVAPGAPAHHLVDVVVHPGRRGSGVGTAALRAWLADLDREGASAVLRVAALSPARGWYERHGFIHDPGAGDDPVRTTMRREALR